jgi:hypothetical protein
MKKVDLSRKVFDKNKFGKTISNDFQEILPPAPDGLAPGPNVGQFFQDYATLFYDIPKTGDTNSHEFLARQSGNYIDGAAINDSIAALLEEINSLRQELFELEAQRLRDLAANAEEAVNLSSNG